jgi:hypothetical protein
MRPASTGSFLASSGRLARRRLDQEHPALVAVDQEVQADRQEDRRVERRVGRREDADDLAGRLGMFVVAELAELAVHGRDRAAEPEPERARDTRADDRLLPLRRISGRSGNAAPEPRCAGRLVGGEPIGELQQVVVGVDERPTRPGKRQRVSPS